MTSTTYRPTATRPVAYIAPLHGNILHVCAWCEDSDHVVADSVRLLRETNPSLRVSHGICPFHRNEMAASMIRR